MHDTPSLVLTAFILAVFTLAGLAKGVIGLGLPTIAMGMLALAMPRVEAATLLLLPSFLTNVWQMLAGPSLLAMTRRLWPMLAGVCLGTFAGRGLMAGSGREGGVLLGGALVLYAITGLLAILPRLPEHLEPVAGPLVGATTGLVTAATGVFVIPAVPFLQAIGLETNALVQALGLSFTVSTVALAANLSTTGALHATQILPSLAALFAAFIGMGLGQALRARLAPAVFRRCFFVGLLLLGLAEIGSALT